MTLRRVFVLSLLLSCPSLASAQTLRADRFVLNTGPCSFLSGPASPEGASNGVAGPCSWYYQTASPFTTYRKMSGTGNTGWVALSTGGGSVTSVGLTVPSIFSVSGSPITGSGSFGVTLNTQSAAFVFAGPTSGGAASPTFRALALTDLPAGTGTVTSVGLALPNIFSVSGSPVTTDGTITATLVTQAANTFFAGPTSGGAATPGFRIAVLADLPVVDVPHGGTGVSTLAANGVVYGNGASNVGVTSAGGANSVLAANGGAPAFSTTPTVTNLTATGTVAAAILTASTSTTTALLTATSDAVFGDTVGTTDYASQTTGWRVTEPGAADFRYLFVDEMHAKLFIADLEQALAGGQIVAKSVAVLSASFTCPAAGGTATLSVEDLPSAADMQVFQANDYVVVRSFARASGSLTIGDCVGVVTAPSTAPAGYQTWTFTRGSGACSGAMTASTVVLEKSLALDYGVTGNGYYEVSAVDGAYGANSPYAQIVTWATCPVAANRTLRTRFGRLDGITSGSSEYGMIAGTYAGTNGQYFRASNQAFELHGIDLLLWQGATNTLKLDHAGPSLAIGSPVPSAYGTGTGIWMGNDGGTYKARFGNPAGNRMTWDGTTLTLVGEGGGITNISGANIQTGSITLSQVNFVPVLGTNVVASINASAEGIQISGARIGINGLTTFSAGYDPTSKIAAGGAAADVNAGVTVITGGLITVNSSSTFGSGYDPTGKIASGGAAADVNAGSTVIAGGKITVSSASTFASGYDPTGRIAAGGAAADVNANSTVITGGKITVNSSSTFGSGYDPTGKIATGGAAADVNAGSTVITGGLITVNGSSTFAAGYNPTGKITAGGAAADINANVTTISGGKIMTASVTATQIFVTELAALNATLGGWTMATDHLFNGTGAARVGLYVGGGTTIRIYAGSETAASAPFRVDASGALTATNATITGAVTATSGSFTGTVTAATGTIGGWSISSDRIIKGPNAGDTCGLYSGAANNIRLFCGSETITDAPFRVDKFGALTASSGTVAGWVLAADHFYSGSGSGRVGLYNGSGTTIRFYAGSESAASAPFRVDESGAFVATNATITGAVTATSGSFTGAVTATSGSFTGNGAGVTNIDGGNIQANTITATQIATMDLSAISASLGTVTSGAISGTTFSVASGAVVLDSDGITLAAGTGNINSVKWSDGSYIYSASGTMLMTSGGTINVLNSQMSFIGSSAVQVNSFSGSGDVFVCANNVGVLEASASSCMATIAPTNLDFSGYVIGQNGAVIRMLGWQGAGEQFVCADNNGYFHTSPTACN